MGILEEVIYYTFRPGSDIVSTGQHPTMTNSEQEAAIRVNVEIIWEQIGALDELPIFPAIIQEMLVTAKEEKYD